LGTDNWPCLILALCGDAGHVPHLVGKLSSDNHPPGTLSLALGILGDCRCLPPLLNALNRDSARKQAALALSLITGAGLPETEPAQDNRENQRLLSGEPEAWEQWLKANIHRFDPQLRYRKGKPCSAIQLADDLNNACSSLSIRMLAHEELVIRYGLDTRFETDMPVRQQKEAIQLFRNRARETLGRFKPGFWFLNGKPLPG
ncbi:MAG: hypothetical protein V1793_08025, partial [Pseudomonadota bacterium]